jgi:hypothetical protein
MKVKKINKITYLKAKKLNFSSKAYSNLQEKTEISAINAKKS